MSLTKVTYNDGETVIHASNLNDIQDEIIINATSISTKVDKVIGSSLVSDEKVSLYDTHISNSDIHVTTDDKTNWNNKLDKSGGTISGNLAVTGTVTTSSDVTVGRDFVVGKVRVEPSNTALTNSYNEGIRINQATNGWAEVLFGAPKDTSTGSQGGWLVGRRGASSGIADAGDFTIAYDTSGDSNALVLKPDGSLPYWNKQRLAYQGAYANGTWSTSDVASGTQISYSKSITTHGRPVFIAISYDLQGSGGSGYWGTMAIYRDSTHLRSQTGVSAGNSYNVPGCIVYLDVVDAGTYTYNFYYKTGSGTTQLHEVNLYGAETPSIVVFEI